MNLSKILLLLTIAISASVCNGYRVLGIYPFPVKSHFIMINQLLKGLARKGHQVDVITGFQQNEIVPNYKQIMTLPDTSGLFSYNLNDLRSIPFRFNFLGAIGYNTCKSMEHPEFLNLARNPPKDRPYDVIITHMMNYHCFMILGHLWNIPVVLVSTTAMYPWMHDMIGNPENVAISPNNMISIPAEDGLWKRLCNTYAFYLLKFNYLYYTTDQDQLLQKNFGPDAPSIRELERSVSLVLMNTYFPINGVKPMTTGVIEVGGLHIQNDGSELEEGLKKWLDESKDGVLYFTFGSTMRIEVLPKEVLTIIFKTLENVAPVRVLLRINNTDDLPIKLPSNFYALPWIPQQKVLQHPNVKVFITHGGLLGTQESIYYGVPMLCMPILADQWTNSKNYVKHKIAIMRDAYQMTQQDFDRAVTEILNNPIYRENAQKLSRLFRDRPQNAMDTAAFWIEFVVRNGKDSLRSPAMDLTWWQVALLDVYAITITGIAIVLYLVISLIRILLKILRKVVSLINTKKQKVS